MESLSQSNHVQAHPSKCCFCLLLLHAKTLGKEDRILQQGR